MERNPYRVGDVMTHAVVAVGRKALFEDILERMEKWQVSGLPVLEGDGRSSNSSLRPISCPRRCSGAATPSGRLGCGPCPSRPRRRR
ncbi:CBS domain-containing protein [Streptomyces sp. NBC_01558]|uniref:CBS domain-containing protein n=1 Tax=Streptomyces sp. NBC_01558 TaxID=2975878 RepID=UPI003FA359C1